MATTPGLDDHSALIIRKIHKYYEHMRYESIFVGGINDSIDEWGVVESIMEEFNLGTKRPETVSGLLNMLGYETAYVIPDDVYDFGQPFKSDVVFDMAVSLSGLAGKIANQATFFENFHNLVKPGGTIIHSGVWQNAKDNRFYSHNPLFWARLAQVLHYGVSAHLLHVGNTLCRFEHPSLDGTDYELVSKYNIRHETRPAVLYTIYNKSEENIPFEFEL